MLRRSLSVLCVVLVLMALAAAPALAEGTAKECKAKSEKAAAYLAEKGEAAFAEIGDPNSEWAKDPYVFVHDFKGVMLAHHNQKLVGKNLISIKDVKGKMFPAEMVAIAKGPGKGWVEYWWPKPGEKKPSQKVAYIVRVPGKEWFVGTGVYDYSEEQAIKEAGK